MYLSKTQRQANTKTPPPQIAVFGVDSVLRINNDELKAIINHNERQLTAAQANYPYLTKLKLVGKLTGLGRLYDYWRLKCLGEVRFSSYLVPLEKRNKHGIVYCADDNQFHPTKATTKKAIEQWRATHRPRLENSTKFHYNDIVIDDTPLPEFLRFGTWTAPQADTATDTAPSLAKSSIEQSRVVDSLKRQISSNAPPSNPSNLSDCYGITGHQFFKYSQIEFANTLLPDNHPIRQTMKFNTGKVTVYGDGEGIIYTKGGIRTRNPYSVFDNCFDGQKENEFAKLVQQNLLKQGFNTHKATLNYPHHQPDITIDLPLLNKTRQKFIKEFQRQLDEHLPHIDISMRLVALENPLTKANGYNSHYHIVYIIKQRLTSSQQRKFSRLHCQTWLRALRNSKLIDKNATPEYISDIQFNDRNALAYVTKYDKSYHLPSDMDEIESRWQSNQSVTVFELISLAKYDRIPTATAKKHYRQLLTAMHGLEKVKYSRALNAFCIEHGLIEPINATVALADDIPSDDTPSELNKPQPPVCPLAEPVYSYQNNLFDDNVTVTKYQKRRAGAGRKKGHRYDPTKQLTFAPLLELLYQQAIERANRPKPVRYRRITDTDYNKLSLLVTFDGAEFARLTETYDYLAVLNRIRDDYRAGVFNAKPHSYYQSNPRPS